MGAVPPLAIDLTRLLAGALRATPRGIDRVELLYAQHFLTSWPGECFSVLATPAGPRAFRREQAHCGVDIVAKLWGESAENPSRSARLSGAGRRLLAMPLGLGRPAARLPAGSLYLNVGHFGLAGRNSGTWLRRRPDIRAVFMLHDLIPLQQPEHVSPAETRYFKRVVENLALAHGIILNSQDVADVFARSAAAQRAATFVRHLPVETAFLTDRPAAAADNPRYVVACGQIDPRKNYDLLSRVWAQLSQDDGPDLPLFIVGRRGAAADDLINSIRRWDPRGRCIQLQHGLTTPQLRALLQRATALVAPSKAEGFDLPVIEALALGVPVLASDIPVHREVGGEHAVYLSPDDAGAWIAALRRLRDQPAERRSLQAIAQAFRAQTPKTYFAAVARFLHEVAAAS